MSTHDAAPAPDAPVVLDRETLANLLEVTGGDAAFLAEMIDAYFADAPPLLDAMAAAAAEGVAAALRRAAHSLKSTSATLGALALAARCRAVEAEAGAGRLADADANVAAAAAAYTAVRQALLAARPRTG